jgi:Flp pilus assembly pilin Flp
MKSTKAVSHRGNAIVEYVLITALVALAAIAMFRTYRSDVNEAYRKAGQALVQGVDDSLTSNPDGHE